MKSIIAMIVDRSGSMSGLRDDTIGSFNQFIADQKAIPGEADFCLTLFNSSVEIGSVVPLPDVEPLTEKTYAPSGMTALYDAMGITIDKIGKLLEEGKANADKVIVCTITDGYENSSQEYSASRVREMVKHQTEKYSWDFIFLGANIDAFGEGANLNIKRDSTQQYEPTSMGLQSAYSFASKSVAASRMKQS